MNTEKMARMMTGVLLPALASLSGRDAKTGDPEEGIDPTPLALWSLLSSHIEKREALKSTVAEIISSQPSQDAVARFSLQLKELLVENADLARAVEKIVRRAPIAIPGGEESLSGLLGKDDRSMRRLEIVYLIRSGLDAQEIARLFQVDVEEVFRLNAYYSVAGLAGLISDAGVQRWLNVLDTNDPILKRLEMVRLVRSGTPCKVIAEEYGVLEDYVQRIEERFARHGVLGIITEEDFERFRALHPPTVRICSYNLHGTHGNGRARVRRVARELAMFEPHLTAFQEVVSEDGAEDTSEQIARWISSMTGYRYRSRFSYCHQFMDRYPEGIAIAARYPLENVRTIDLTEGLRGGLSPSMARNALTAETNLYGKTFLVSSVHLDHIADSQVRLAQAEKLVREIDLYMAERHPYCAVLAGDFNDVETSPALNYLRSAGYRDAFRVCHKNDGNTFPSREPRIRIDYIFIKGDATVLSSGLLLKDPELSDHIGVFAEVR